MRDLSALSHEELFEVARVLREMISGLEIRGARRTVYQDKLLKEHRAEFRRVKKAIKSRHVQPRLFE